MSFVTTRTWRALTALKWIYKVKRNSYIYNTKKLSFPFDIGHYKHFVVVSHKIACQINKHPLHNQTNLDQGLQN